MFHIFNLDVASKFISVSYLYRSKDPDLVMAGTIFTPSLEGMKHVKSEDGEMLTKHFLDVCKLILPVLGNFKPSSCFLHSKISLSISINYCITRRISWRTMAEGIDLYS